MTHRLKLSYSSASAKTRVYLLRHADVRHADADGRASGS